jgi:GT2 family glycosyltransferase
MAADTSQDAVLPVSLIICSRDRSQMLVETVDSILAGDSVPAEIVIIDQSKTAHPTLAGRHAEGGCAIRYLWSRTTGLSVARNIAIAAATQSIVAVTDDDVLVAPDWLRTLTHAQVEVGPHGVVTGQVRATEPEQKGGFQLTLKTDATPAVYKGRIGTDVLYTLNMAFYRLATAEVGCFDERLGPGTPFPGAEDNDFGYRLLEMGYTIHYVPSAVVFHRAWRPRGAFLRLNFNYGLGVGAFYAKYLSLRDRYMLRRMRRDVLHRLHQMATFLLRRYLQPLLTESAYTLGIALGAAAWLLTRSKARSPKARSSTNVSSD